MPLSEMLRLPTRVSRLYPIFAFGLLLSSGALFYSWKLTEIYSTSTLAQRDQEIASLNAQVAILLEQQKADQASLQVQRQKVETATTQLKELESTLASKASELEGKEKDLKTAQEQLKNQQSQLSNNASELEKLRSRPPLFSFQNNSSQPGIETQQAEVKSVVTSAYEYIQDIYGSPYLLNSVVIAFVDEFSIPGSAGEIVIENSSSGIKMEIRIKKFSKNSFQDVNTMIHEIIHAFHGVAVFDSSAMEEGITVAAADAVMARMIADGKLPNFSPLYLTISPATYSQWNSSLTVHADSNAFYSNPHVSKVYQLVGEAWMRLYREDANFFKKLNATYYQKVQKGQNLDNAAIRDLIRGVIPTVNGESINSYLSNNRAFNPS